jgi:hypothetical protein
MLRITHCVDNPLIDVDIMATLRSGRALLAKPFLSASDRYFREKLTKSRT